MLGAGRHKCHTQVTVCVDWHSVAQQPQCGQAAHAQLASRRLLALATAHYILCCNTREPSFEHYREGREDL